MSDFPHEEWVSSVSCQFKKFVFRSRTKTKNKSTEPVVTFWPLLMTVKFVLLTIPKRWFQAVSYTQLLSLHYVSSHLTTKKDHTPLLPPLTILRLNSPNWLYVQAAWILTTPLHPLRYPLLNLLLPFIYTPHPFLLYHPIRPGLTCSLRLGMD